jgi:hypothetical protein
MNEDPSNKGLTGDEVNDRADWKRLTLPAPSEREHGKAKLEEVLKKRGNRFRFREKNTELTFALVAFSPSSPASLPFCCSPEITVHANSTTLTANK